MFKNARFIAFQDTRFMLREKSTLIWLFLMPVVFFYFIGTVTSGFDGSSATAPARLYLEGPVSQTGVLDDLLERLQKAGFQLTQEEKAPEANGHVLRIPEDFEKRVAEGEPVVLEYLASANDLQADYDQFRLLRTVYTLLADVIVVKEDGAALTAASLKQTQSRTRRLDLEVSAAGREREIPSGFSQAVPGTLVMFTLVVVLTSGATLLIIEREKGLLRRLAATPIRKHEVVLGKWLGRMFLAMIQIAFAMLTGTLLFGMDWGPDLLMILLVLFAWGAFCASFGLLLGNLARSQGQAVGLGVLTANLLGALGGCWWPIEITPAWMQGLQRALPSGWTMNALHQLSSFRAGWTSGISAMVLLLLGALLLGTAASRVFRYE